MNVMEKATNDKRLIDADALLNEFLKRYTERERNGNLVFAACEIKQDFADMISDFPTVDAVEVVVRCRECKHRGTDYCIFHIKGEPADEELLLKLDNDFCSYGERKEGAER